MELNDLPEKALWAKSQIRAVVKHFESNKHGFSLTPCNYRRLSYHITSERDGVIEVIGMLNMTANESKLEIWVDFHNEEIARKQWTHMTKMTHKERLYCAKRRPKWNKFGAHILSTLGSMHKKETVSKVMET